MNRDEFQRRETIQHAGQNDVRHHARIAEKHDDAADREFFACRVEEVAVAVLWLASDEASFVTGTLLSVDGGWTAS